IVAAVEQAPGLAVRGIDRDGIVRYWSLGAARLYGVTAELALGQPWATVAAVLPGAVTVAEEVAGDLAAVWDSGKARGMRLWKLDADGAAPRCICSTVFPVIQSGRVRQVVCIDVDITASGQDGAVQGALLLMGDNFRQLYEKSADAIVLLR
ncbi:MAG: PAS domain-containing protein, partial [Janthinobacterium sp.]